MQAVPFTREPINEARLGGRTSTQHSSSKEHEAFTYKHSRVSKSKRADSYPLHAWRSTSFVGEEGPLPKLFVGQCGASVQGKKTSIIVMKDEDSLLLQLPSSFYSLGPH
jgi:hypothetical protein